MERISVLKESLTGIFNAIYEECVIQNEGKNKSHFQLITVQIIIIIIVVDIVIVAGVVCAAMAGDVLIWFQFLLLWHFERI